MRNCDLHHFLPLRGIVRFIALLCFLFHAPSLRAAHQSPWDTTFIPIQKFSPSKAHYKISKHKNLLPEDLEHAGTLTYSQIASLKNIAKGTRSVFIFFSLHNTSAADSVFYVSLQDEFVPEVYLYEMTSAPRYAGGTGFAHMQSKLSVPNTDRHIVFRLPPHKERRYILQVRDFEGGIFVPGFSILNEQAFLKAKPSFENRYEDPYNALTLLIVGVHFCLAVIGVFWSKNNRFKRPLVIFTIINFMYIFYYLNIYGFINFENNMLPGVKNIVYRQFWGCLEPVLYYWFFYSYLTFNKSYRLAGVLLKYAGLYWLIYFILRIGDYNAPFLISATHVIREFATVFDFAITFLVFLYLLKFKSPFYKYARLGVSILLVSAVQMSAPFIAGILGIGHLPIKIGNFSYAIMQVAIIADFLLFLYGVSVDTLKAENEKKKLENKLLETEIQRQRDIITERERISHDMHDDLGAGISAIKLQAELLKQKLREQPAMQEDVEDLLQTSFEMNRSMREMLWSLDSHNDRPEQFVQYAASYAELFLKKAHINCVIDTEGQQSELLMSVTTRRNLFLCLKEALNNIHKHSRAVTVHILFEWEDSRFLMQIADNGVGFSSPAARGNGLQNMQQRMKNSGGGFEVTNIQPGIRLRFSVPLQAS
ncbi:sensor histidine kinase [Niabella drilacis]|uniref:Signal transduction histidine kinase n=1 Tax=Niabella drilacis (strain DSM 25811 / CCM 8410 / CCUG 62505 / LMG 26954 / E90) TaxID=1285928 RepID=A0A1G6J3S8_NIADE|nr:histidine kinase [Niabella drilacis]SDC13317.1 Signal transduction histidine kinase [Niabella drilacis]